MTAAQPTTLGVTLRAQGQGLSSGLSFPPSARVASLCGEPFTHPRTSPSAAREIATQYDLVRLRKCALTIPELNRAERYVRDPTQAYSARGGGTEINNAPFDERSTIIDADYDRPTGMLVRHPHPASEWQRSMCGRISASIHMFPTRRLAAAVYRRDARLQPSSGMVE